MFSLPPYPESHPCPTCGKLVTKNQIYCDECDDKRKRESEKQLGKKIAKGLKKPWEK